MVSERKPGIFSLHIFGQIAAVAVPSILQQSFVSVGNIIIQSLINGYGAPVIAGYAAAIKLNNLVITSLTTLANGISNFASQNLGAGKYERIHSGFKAGLKMVFLLCIPIVIVYVLWGKMVCVPVYGKSKGTCHGYGNSDPQDPFSFLFCGIREAGGRRRPAGNKPYGAVYGFHLYRPDP